MRSSASDTTIGLLGFGNMGRALAAGWIARGYSAANITVIDPQPDAQAAARSLGLNLGGPSAPLPGVVVVAVKPAQVAAALEPYAAIPKSGAVFLSIVAGKTTTQLSQLTGGDAAIVRAMPNTPAAIGQGVTGLFASATTTAEQRDLCADLMLAVGTVEWLEDETLLDVVTAVSGSGPAYVFLLIECLAEAGKELGLDAGAAARLATAVVAGSGAYARASEESAAQLRRRVTSPQGTTQAALDVLQAPGGGLAQLIERAVRAAAARSRELSAE
jgi:pyrroline-5-carboxylate reductase